MELLPESTIGQMLRAALSGGADFADIFSEARSVFAVHLEDGGIERVISGSESGTGMRTVFGEHTSFAYSNDFSSRTLLEVAAAVSGSSTPPTADPISLVKTLPLRVYPVVKPPSEVATDRKIALLRGIDEVARACDRRIRQVSASYHEMVQHVQIANSERRLVRDCRTYVALTIHVIASDGTALQSSSETAGSTTGFELFDEVNPEEMALAAASRAVRMLTADPAPAGRMPVVLASVAGGTMIHEAVGHGLEADLAQQGLSVYSDMVSRKIASEHITVVDDATLPGKRGSFAFDDEGTPSQRTILISNGTLTSYMYDKITARKDRVDSTGNGRRQSYKFRPVPRMTNTILMPGKQSPDEIVKGIPKGLLVKKMGGGQVNTVTGDFVFDVQEGYLIDNGVPSEPVRGATLVGNGPEVLKSIDMVGTDLGFSIGTCGKDSQGVPISDAIPTLRIPEIVVGGRV